VADAQAVLDAGADKVSVNSAAVARPELIDELADASARSAWCWPSTRSAAASSWEVFVAAGAPRPGRDAVAWAREGRARAGEILLTQHGLATAPTTATTSR
jgi:cyclase